jgi:hypothetical protein
VQGFRHAHNYIKGQNASVSWLHMLHNVAALSLATFSGLGN